MKTKANRRMWSLDGLPMPRAFFRGPRWKRECEVREVPIAEIDSVAARFHRLGRKLLVFSFENEVRERACHEIRPGVSAEWSDPLEQLGIAR